MNIRMDDDHTEHQRETLKLLRDEGSIAFYKHGTQLTVITREEQTKRKREDRDQHLASRDDRVEGGDGGDGRFQDANDANARNGMEEIPDSEFSGAFKHDEMFLQSQETPQTPHRSNSSGGSTAGSGSSASKRMGRGRASGGRGIIIDSGVRRPGATTTPVSSERLGDNHGRSPLRGLGRGMGSAVASYDIETSGIVQSSGPDKHVWTEGRRPSPAAATAAVDRQSA